MNRRHDDYEDRPLIKFLNCFLSSASGLLVLAMIVIVLAERAG